MQLVSLSYHNRIKTGEGWQTPPQALDLEPASSHRRRSPRVCGWGGCSHRTPKIIGSNVVACQWLCVFTPGAFQSEESVMWISLPSPAYEPLIPIQKYFSVNIYNASRSTGKSIQLAETPPTFGRKLGADPQTDSPMIQFRAGFRLAAVEGGANKRFPPLHLHILLYFYLFSSFQEHQL